MKLSIVTGKVEREFEFKRLVASILEHTKIASWEFVVADASLEAYEADHPNIRVIHENPRQTHSRGYNMAFKAARGEYILWLNDDAEVCEGYDTEAVKFMEAHPKIGLGCLHYSEPASGIPFHVNSAWGCLYANFGIFKKSIGEEVGYYDEDLVMYGADNSFALKILMADYGIADIPSARIIHHSKQDNIRAANQAHRLVDNRTLSAKYMPYRRHWVKSFQKHRLWSGHEPWSHGTPRAAMPEKKERIFLN
jgi:GT2 family glycosyltransferase